MLLADQTLCVCELEDGLRLPQSILSSHLTIMRAAGLLEVQRREKWAFYRMAPALLPLFKLQRKHFAGSLASDPVYAAKHARTVERVALRGQSDCGRARRRANPPRLCCGGSLRRQPPIRMDGPPPVSPSCSPCCLPRSPRRSG